MASIPCPHCGKPVELPKKTGLAWGIGCLIAALAIPILLAILGIIAAIAIPSFVNARAKAQNNACMANLHQIETAKLTAIAAHDYGDGAEVPEGDVAEGLPGGMSALVCPAGGTYSIQPAGEEPACSVHGTIQHPATSGAVRTNN